MLVSDLKRCWSWRVSGLFVLKDIFIRNVSIWGFVLLRVCFLWITKVSVGRYSGSRYYRKALLDVASWCPFNTILRAWVRPCLQIMNETHALCKEWGKLRIRNTQDYNARKCCNPLLQRMPRVYPELQDAFLMDWCTLLAVLCVWEDSAVMPRASSVS